MDAKAEAGLLELVRLEDAQNFTLSITVRDGRWMVASEDRDALVSGRGHGASFAQAWFDRSAPELKG